MKVKGKGVFISGPMSSVEAYNVGAFAKAHHILKVKGAARIYDPALEYLLEEGEAKSHEHYLRVCIHELTKKGKYDVLVQLPGWWESEGARTEHEVAMACGIKCVSIDSIM